MGCSVSKQNLAKDDDSIDVKPAKQLKAPKPVKRKIQSKSTAVECIDEVNFGTNADSNPQQRSITPPSSVSSHRRRSKFNCKQWTDEDLLCQLQNLDNDTGSNIVRMFDEGNTIPFMCRYRRELIGNLSPDE